MVFRFQKSNRKNANHTSSIIPVRLLTKAQKIIQIQKKKIM